MSTEIELRDIIGNAGLTNLPRLATWLEGFAQTQAQAAITAGDGVSVNGGQVEVVAGSGVVLNGGTVTAPGQPVVMHWTAGQNPNGRVVMTASRAMVVTGIVGRLETNDGAGIIYPVKVADGTAVASGTTLSVGDGFKCDGSISTNNTLTLSGTAAVLALAAGDSLGVKTSGTFATSAGALSFFVVPTA